VLSAVRIRTALARFLSDERGQGTLEYVLLLTFCLISGGALFRKLIEMMDGGFQVFGAQLERDLKSGRHPLSVWKN
jgi:Flp pilus assembly pilin Flp